MIVGALKSVAFGVADHIFTKSLIMIGAGIVLVAVVAATVTAFIRARTAPASNSCINILRQIDGATQQWAMEKHMTTNDIPSWEDVRFYLKDPQVPACPQGGTYTLGRLDTPPRCSYPGHKLPY